MRENVNKQRSPTEGEQVTDAVYLEMLQQQEPDPCSLGKEDSEKLHSEAKHMDTLKTCYAGNLWFLEKEERLLLCLQNCSY